MKGTKEGTTEISQIVKILLAKLSDPRLTTLSDLSFDFCLILLASVWKFGPRTAKMQKDQTEP